MSYVNYYLTVVKFLETSARGLLSILRLMEQSVSDMEFLKRDLGVIWISPEVLSRVLLRRVG